MIPTNARLSLRVAAAFLAACLVRADEAPLMSTRAIESHIEYLASDELEGRDAGTEGSRKTEAYIHRAFERARLDAVEYQKFEFVAGSKLLEGNELEIGEEALAARSFRPRSFSGPGKGIGQAVFAGYGIEARDLGHDDYKGLDVERRVVVVLAGSPDGDNPHGKFAEHVSSRSKALVAVEKKAAALVVLMTADEEGVERLPEFVGEGHSRDVGLPVIAVKASAAAAALGIDVEEAIPALNEHKSASRELDLKVRYDVRIQVERRETKNVLGWLRAKSPEAVDELVIVGAHHDHLGRGGAGSRTRDRFGEIHNGADDNASGVATLIEIARYLSPRAKNLRRHVLFMTFAAEERGLLGSKHFQKEPLLRLPKGASDAAQENEIAVKPVAMINLDMVGRLRENRLLASGLATSKEWPELLESVRVRGGHTLTLRGDKDKDLLGSSDHTTFYAMGMPVVFFFTGSHKEYHTPDDDLYRKLEGGGVERLINIRGMQRVVRYVGDVTMELASRDKSLPYEKGVELTPRMHFRVVLRLLPDYAGDVDGMRVSSVTSGGPAAEAGMKAGDVIIRFGMTPVRSVRDYMVGLGKAKPGEEIQVEVMRDGETKLLKVTPAALGRTD